jgi:hypothetical protein
MGNWRLKIQPIHSSTHLLSYMPITYYLLPITYYRFTKPFTFENAKSNQPMNFFKHSNLKTWTIAALVILATPAVAIGLRPAEQSPQLANRELAERDDRLLAQTPLRQSPVAPPNLEEQPGVRPGPAQYPTQYFDARQVEKADREIRKAREEAFSVRYLADQVSSADGSEVATIAADILQQAESSYSAGEFFQAEKQAKAAKDAYEAAETLYEAELGYTVGRRGPSGPSRSYYEAPYRAQEQIARAQAEMDYYRSNSPVVSDLIQRASALASSTIQAQAQPVSAYDFGELARSRAAEHLAKAAVHLMEADRGF